MSDFYLIYKNMTRKPLRLFLTCFSIFIAFLIFGTIITFKSALDAGVEMSADNRLVVFNRINFTVPLPESYFHKVAAVEGVRDVTHLNWFGGYYQEPANIISVMAVEPESYLDVYSDQLVPPEQREAWLRNRQGILVGQKLAEMYGWKIGDRVPISSNIFSHRDGGQTWDFVVEGIFHNADAQADTRMAVFHYKYFQETATFGGDTIGWLTLTTEDASLNEQVAKTIDAMFANSPYETDTSTEKAFSKAFIEQIGNIGLIIFGVVFMAFFTILVVVGNTMALAIRERTGEIAVLKTLGFSSPRIFRMVLSESLLIALLGGLSGLAMAYFLLEGIKSTMGQFLPNLIMDGKIVIQAVGYMLLLGIVTGLLPALNALRLNIVTAFNRG
ncbi:putative ABC transport system permease protein [Microbulbifer thermotolerans]|uniref:ABC transporter permease n=2 Tax=Microbulbifer thermotolerans TaxID=252514 RepID=UPI0008E4A042|nr:FtsX-like permease family protein [Microbulbifer thermotolerans]MCX2793981.1 FtsX-like permease family protein [Microbulbifer thermotolerans]MCX2833427.1 FtsX-like permease family protein [Microbulbifer thermotolerans]SFC19389.1 putative ABC transport system permease protein [Microbulbifer thermotolerans]